MTVFKLRRASFLLLAVAVLARGAAGVSSAAVAPFDQHVAWSHHCGEGGTCSEADETACPTDCENWCSGDDDCNNITGHECEAAGSPCWANCICYYAPKMLAGAPAL